jgi:MOSC domain-containing protein YiiM
VRQYRGVATLLAVCRVHALLHDPGLVGITAIDKRPAEGPVLVRPYGLFADVQADREYHGGLDKAVYAYAQESAQTWSAELGREVVPGLFGENLRTEGLDVDGALVGEHWQVGAAGTGPLLEVTQPRTPCATFGRHLGEERWMRRFTRGGLPGAYLRVLREGVLRAGDPVHVVHRPGHGVSVGAWFAAASRADAAALLAAHQAGEVRLAQALRDDLEPVLARS